MSTVAFVLFALSRFHSPGVAGIGVFCLVFPGLLLSPVSGALLDRFGRRRLMALDFGVAAAGMFLIAGLALAGTLNVAGLLLITSLVSLTSTLSNAGARSLFPLLVPSHLWERANAADTICYGVAAVTGPALAGQVTSWFGSSAALGSVALGYVLAAVMLLGVSEPKSQEPVSSGVFRDSWSGLRYVALHRTLRWLAVGLSFSNAGFGILTVVLPVLVFKLHGTAALVGGLFALEGGVGICAAVLAGRVRTLGRERAILCLCFVLTSVSLLLMAAPAMSLLFVGMAGLGAQSGPLNVTTFSIRQRRTDPSAFGRSFAISMALNYAGAPIGAALAGPLIHLSSSFAIVVAAGLALVGASTTWRIPRHGEVARLD